MVPLPPHPASLRPRPIGLCHDVNDHRRLLRAPWTGMGAGTPERDEEIEQEIEREIKEIEQDIEEIER
jgi:hypothetical protein